MFSTTEKPNRQRQKRNICKTSEKAVFSESNVDKQSHFHSLFPFDLVQNFKFYECLSKCYQCVVFFFLPQFVLFFFVCKMTRLLYTQSNFVIFFVLFFFSFFGREKHECHWVVSLCILFSIAIHRYYLLCILYGFVASNPFVDSCARLVVCAQG